MIDTEIRSIVYPSTVLICTVSTVEMWGKILVITALVSVSTVHSSCRGRTILTNVSGIVTDGDKQYPAYARCEWLIDGEYHIQNKSDLEFLLQHTKNDIQF